MGVLTRQVDVCFMDKNKQIQHTRVSLKVGSVLTYENIRAALSHEIKQRDERMIADTKRLYDAVKAKYEETKATGAPLFEEFVFTLDALFNDLDVVHDDLISSIVAFIHSLSSLLVSS